MIKYGLMYNGKILGFTVRGDWDKVYELDSHSGEMWLVDTPEHANYVRYNSTQWYNADYDTPVNTYDDEDTYVVEVKIDINKIEVNNLPSFEKLIKVIHKNEPRHVAYVLETCPVSQRQYSLYDYKEYLEKTK